MDAETHIIGRQNIAVTYHGQADAFALQKEVNMIFNDRLPGRLSELMDRFSQNGQTIRLDKVEINARIDAKDNLEDAILSQIEKQLGKQLSQSLHANPQKVTATDAQGNFITVLAFYLIHGYLPWWSPAITVEAWRAACNEFFSAPKNHVHQTIIPLLQQPEAVARLVALLNDEQLFALVDISGAELKTIRTNIVAAAPAISMPEATIRHLINGAVLSMIRKPGNDLYMQFAQAFLALIPAEIAPVKKELFIAQLESKSLKLAFTEASGSSATKEPRTPEPNNSFQLPTDESILTNTGGLALIAPYLPIFFTHLDLVADKKITDPQRAVTLLHFIATGNEIFEEFEIALEKTLLGLTVNEVVLPGYSISQEEKDQVHEMLTAVIAHWEILKHTSVAGLQSAFLAREGRLSQKNNQWRLLVQRRAHDMLLDYIPWNFKLIKLPWMSQLLTVEWI